MAGDGWWVVDSRWVEFGIDPIFIVRKVVQGWETTFSSWSPPLYSPLGFLVRELVSLTFEPHLLVSHHTTGFLSVWRPLITLGDQLSPWRPLFSLLQPVFLSGNWFPSRLGHNYWSPISSLSCIHLGDHQYGLPTT